MIFSRCSAPAPRGPSRAARRREPPSPARPRKDDDARLVELAGAVIDEFDTHRGLAGTDGTFDENHVAPGNAASQDGIEPGYSSLDRI